MRNRNWVRMMCALLFVVFIALTGCKKHVAASTPTTPPAQPTEFRDSNEDSLRDLPI